MAAVEIRLSPSEVSRRLDEIRRWLNTRGISGARFTSTGSSDEAVISVEFASNDDAAAFAKQFAGTLVES